jgi:hypothetical protein
MGFLRRNDNGFIDRMDFSSSHELEARRSLYQLFESSPIPSNQVLENLGLFVNSKLMSRILFFKHFYSLALQVPGQIFDFGTRWGQNLALFTAFRNIYEPYNRTRNLVGFDTFTGFPGIDFKDGLSQLNQVGNLSTVDNYEEFLSKLLTTLEQDTPLAHIKRFEIITGDVTVTLPKYLVENPHTIVSHAYFDLDLYQPTFQALEMIWHRCPKGAVIGFDELNDKDSPGETLALLEKIGIGNLRLQRLSNTSRTSFFVKE